jgi:hypothetical protein
MEERRDKELQELHGKVAYEYSLYTNDPFLVSAKYNSLFTKYSLEQ